jgi:hypothetical protein
MEEQLENFKEVKYESCQFSSGCSYIGNPTRCEDFLGTAWPKIGFFFKVFRTELSEPVKGEILFSGPGMFGH